MKKTKLQLQQTKENLIKELNSFTQSYQALKIKLNSQWATLSHNDIMSIRSQLSILDKDIKLTNRKMAQFGLMR